MTLWDDCTECWDFDGDANAEKDSDHNLTAVNSPAYGTTTPPQGAGYTDLEYDTDMHFTLADDGNPGSAYDFRIGNQDYSLAFWTNLESNYPYIIGKYDAAGGYSIKAAYIVDQTVMTIVHKEAYGSDEEEIWQTLNLYSAWYHVVVAYDHTGGASEKLITTWVSSSGGSFGDTVNGDTVAMSKPPASNDGTLYIGSTNATSTLDGKLDEVAFFNAKLIDATEAESIYDGSWRAAAGGLSIPVAMYHYRSQQ